MCSSRPADPARGRAPWSLRRKLVAQLIGLLAVVCVLIGVLTELALNTYLLGKLDDQLRAISRIDAGPPGPHGRPPGPVAGRDPGQDGSAQDGSAQGAPEREAPGQSIGALRGTVTDGRVSASRLSPDGADENLPAGAGTRLAGLPANGRPQTVDLGAFGDYRVVAATTRDGDVRLTGLPMSLVDDTLRNAGLTLAAVALGGLVLTAVAGAWTVRRTLRPLDRLADTATEVTGLPLDRGEVAMTVRVPAADTDPRTEVGKVGAALNAMLGHVGDALSARQDSETRVRQFVADASHELRTPLAAIRGYAELTRRGGQDVPPAVAHAMSRVESESARMTTLVEDLLLLARLDAGRPLDAGTVDLSRLTADVVSDAHIAGPEHRWLLELPDEPVLVPGDASRLHQVLANLLANARTHTPAGSTVTIALRTTGGGATLSVTDDGPGIPADLLPEVFERFARGDTSRSRQAGSTGLGLAIVAAVVGAHGGRVDVTSEPGRTEFTVRLPAA